MRARGLAAAVGLAGILLVFHTPILSGFARLQVYPLDPLFQNYVLEYTLRWLHGAYGAGSPYFDAPFFYPRPAALSYSEVQWGGLPLYAPWRLLGAAPAVAYALHAIGAVALDYLAALALLGRRGLGFSPGAAIAGAALFAFAGPRAVTVNHPHLMIGFPLVLAVLAARRALDEGAPSRERRVAIVAAALSLAWQFLAAAYVAWMAVFVFLLAIPWMLADRLPRSAIARLLRRDGWLVALAAAGAGLLVLPVARHYLRARAGNAIGGEELDRYLPRLASWLNPGSAAWLGGGFERWSGLDQDPVAWAHALGLGLATLALVGCGLWALRRERWLRPFVAAGASAWLLTLRWPGGWSAWSTLGPALPGGSGLRAVGRLSLVLLLLAAVGLAAFWDRVRPGWPRPLVAALLALAVVEQGRSLPGYSRREIDSRIAAIAAAIPADCPTFYYSPQVTGTDDRKGPQVEAMWASLLRDVPTANGYSSSGPPGWSLELPEIAGGADRAALRRRLNDWVNWQDYPAGGLCWVRLRWLPGGGSVARVERIARHPSAHSGGPTTKFRRR